ncbi:MAG: TlpA family protein disulfide reductase [Sporichthyaceae bacterium]
MRVRTPAAATLLVLLAGCGSSARVAEPTPTFEGVAATPGGRSPVTLHSRPDSTSPPCTGLDAPLPDAPLGARAERALPDLDLACLGAGDGLNLKQLRGPAVLNVWASWCRPCAQEMPYLVEAEAALRDRVRFVGLNLSDDGADARTWNAYHGVGWPSLRDVDGRIRGPLGVPGPPVSFFVGTDGAIAGVHYGAFTSAAQVREALAKYLGIEGSKTSATQVADRQPSEAPSVRSTPRA